MLSAQKERERKREREREGGGEGERDRERTEFIVLVCFYFPQDNTRKTWKRLNNIFSKQRYRIDKPLCGPGRKQWEVMRTKPRVKGYDLKKKRRRRKKERN